MNALQTFTVFIRCVGIDVRKRIGPRACYSQRKFTLHGEYYLFDIVCPFCGTNVILIARRF